MEIRTIRELIYWSYANLAMAHSAVHNSQTTYLRINFSVRSRLFKGLKSGEMSFRSFYDDTKETLLSDKTCVYCGNKADLSIDHIFPKKYGGLDSPENLVLACKHCNSSKGSLDMLEFISLNKQFPPLLLLRRYLKLVYNYCEQHDCLDTLTTDIDDSHFPFKIKNIPTNYPRPTDCKL